MGWGSRWGSVGRSSPAHRALLRLQEQSCLRCHLCRLRCMGLTRSRQLSERCQSAAAHPDESSSQPESGEGSPEIASSAAVGRGSALGRSRGYLAS